MKSVHSFFNVFAAREFADKLRKRCKKRLYNCLRVCALGANKGFAKQQGQPPWQAF